MLLICGASACKRTSEVVERATVSRLGTLDGIETDKGAPVEGVEVTFDSCPDVSWRVYLTSAGPTSHVPAPGVASCLRSLAVGSKLDVTLEVTEKQGERGSLPLRIGPCTLRPTPRDEFDGELKTAGPRRCRWAR